MEGNQERVLVGVDGSPTSAIALAWAARYAKATGATIKCVFAWHYPTAAGPAPVGVAPANVTSEVEEARREELDHAIAACLGDRPAVPVEREVVYGHAAQVLTELSKDADLLVVGSRGHGGFTGLLLGSVSTHCVTHASCPVAVVRHS
jgi:nucleotide-binding universal stress UspA family protein